uniref:Uncharacterized protein n=1 Tax=Oryza brachyantha TaxID=4533 RepID=J3NAG9_ORYBR
MSREKCGASQAVSATLQRCRDSTLEVDSKLVPLHQHCHSLLRPVRRRICNFRSLPQKHHFLNYNELSQNILHMRRSFIKFWWNADGCRTGTKYNCLLLTRVIGGDHAGALEVTIIVVPAIGLVEGIHHKCSMGLHIVRIKARTTALYRFTVNIATCIVDVVLQISIARTSLSNTPLPSTRWGRFWTRVG